MTRSNGKIRAITREDLTRGLQEGRLTCYDLSYSREGLIVAVHDSNGTKLIAGVNPEDLASVERYLPIQLKLAL